MVFITFITSFSQKVDSKILDEAPATEDIISKDDYILNTNTMKAHKSHCDYVNNISDEHFLLFSGSAGDLEKTGYKACGVCKPWT